MDKQPGTSRQRLRDDVARQEQNYSLPSANAEGQNRCDDNAPALPVSVTCLGVFAVYKRGEQILQWDNRKARELLAYLATRPRCAAMHAELVEALWPDDDFVTGQRLLYTAVWALRKTLDDLPASDRAAPVARSLSNRTSSQAAATFRASVLVSGRGHYALDRSLCSVDVADLRRHIEHPSPDVSPAAWLALAARASHPCCAGETYPWLPAVRSHLRRHSLAALRRVVQLAQREGDIFTTLIALHRHLDLDPTHEEIVALAMRLHMRRGELAAASDCYRSFCATLKRTSKYGDDALMPSAELQSLFAAVRASSPSPGMTAFARAPPRSRAAVTTFSADSFRGRSMMIHILLPRHSVAVVRCRDDCRIGGRQLSTESTVPSTCDLSQQLRPTSARPRPVLPRVSGKWFVLAAALLALALAALVLGTPTARTPRYITSTAVNGGQAGNGVAQAPYLPPSPIPSVTAPQQQSPSSPASPPSSSPTLENPASPGSLDTSSPPSAQTPSPGLGLPDPGQWVQQVVVAALMALLSGLLSAIGQILTWATGLHSSAFNFVTLTPPSGTYASAAVEALWRWVAGVADAALALLTLWGGYNAMVRSAIGARYASAMELIPRLMLAALAANLSLLFAGFFVDLNNALCDGVGQVGLPGFGALDSTVQTLAGLVLALVYGVVGLLLVVQMLLRIALLDLLIVTAPLGLLCWALPQTQAWARLWTSTFVATCLVQFLQVLVLKLGASLLLEPTPGRFDVAVLTLLVGIADLYLTFKIPGMLRNWALRSVGAASVGGLVDQGVAWARAAGTVIAAAT